MKICTRCGKSFYDDVDFCDSCGIRLAEVETPEDDQYDNSAENYESENSYIESESEDDENIYFVDGDEEVIAGLGSGYLQNIVSEGNISSVNAFLTPKRIYLDGKTYIISEKTLTAITESKIINVEDVTGTGFVFFSNPTFIAIAIIIFIASIIVYSTIESGGITAIGIFIALVFVAAYFMNRKSIFKIEYAGGSIGFDIKWDNRKASEDFQKEIIRAKDKRRKEIIAESLKNK